MYYQNAQVLGYFAGGVAAATKQITSDRTKQADIIKNVFGTALSLAGGVNSTVGANSTIANGLSQTIVNDVVDRLNKQTMEIDEALTKLTIPHNPQTGKPYNGEAEESYKTNFSWVFNKNQ